MGYADPNAKVTIKMKGLGTAHFNKNTNLWEFLLLRGIPKHELKIIVRKYEKGNDCPIKLRECDISQNIRNLKITTKNPSTSASYYLPAGTGVFTYTSENEYDARWIVDLSELHAKAQREDLQNDIVPIKIKKKYAKRELTLLTVSDAIFHCYKLSPEPYQFEQAWDIFKTCSVGLWIGLDIGWNPDGFTEIDLGFTKINLELSDELDHYEIEVNNDCNCDTDDVDFDLYYRELVDEYEIIQNPPHSAGRVDCHLVQISKIADKDDNLRESLGELL